MVGAEAVEQTESHRLIEQLMVLTNEQVAELTDGRRVPTLYRVHEQPAPERIERLLQQLAALEITGAGAAQTPIAQLGRRDRRRGQPPGGPRGGAARERA